MPVPALVMPPLLITLEIVMSLVAAPLAMVKVLVDPPRSNLELIVAVVAEEFVVTLPPKTKVPVAL